VQRPPGIPSIQTDFCLNYESTLIKEYSVVASINRRLIYVETHKLSVDQELDFLSAQLRSQHGSAPGSSSSAPPIITPLVPENDTVNTIQINYLRRKVRKLKMSLIDTRLTVHKLSGELSTLQGQFAIPVGPSNANRKNRIHRSASRTLSCSSAQAARGEEDVALEVHASPHHGTQHASSGSSSSSSSTSSDEGECDIDPVPPKRLRNWVLFAELLGQSFLHEC
jgi:hypothetical protein